MWTEEQIKKIIQKYNGNYLRGTFDVLSSFALDLTEDAQKMPYVYNQDPRKTKLDMKTKVFLPATSADALTVQNYHGLLMYLNEEFKRDSVKFEVQQNNRDLLYICFENDGELHKEETSSWRISALNKGLPFFLEVRFGSGGYRAFSGEDLIRTQIRCRDFLGPNRITAAH